MPGEPGGRIGVDGACDVDVVVAGGGDDVTAWTGNDVVAIRILILCNFIMD